MDNPTSSNPSAPLHPSSGRIRSETKSTSLTLATTGEILNVPEDCLTLNGALERARTNRSIHVISVNEGDYSIQKDAYGYRCLCIDFSIEIVGRGSKSKTRINGGIRTEKKANGDNNNSLEVLVKVKNFTITNINDHGVYGQSSFTLENVIIDQCGGAGVWAYGLECKAICKDVIIRSCGWSGIIAFDGAVVILMGSKTKIINNCCDENGALAGRSGSSSVHYGLSVWNSPKSEILLVYPLTKESVSMNNNGPCSGDSGGGNWGVGDSSAQLSNIRTIQDPNPNPVTADTIYVPEEFKTLEEAINIARKHSSIHTISIAKGTHKITNDNNKDYYLDVDFRIDIVGRMPPSALTSPTSLSSSSSSSSSSSASSTNTTETTETTAGDPRNDVIILGGIKIKRNIRSGTVGIKNVRICHKEDDGIVGYSPFTVENTIIENCGGVGMWSEGSCTSVVCKNVEIHHNKRSGVSASDGTSITFMGSKTLIHNNCLDNKASDFGVHSISSKILLVSPLTKVSTIIHNGGGGNWDDYKDHDDHHLMNIQNIYL